MAYCFTVNIGLFYPILGLVNFGSAKSKITINNNTSSSLTESMSRENYKVIVI